MKQSQITVYYDPNIPIEEIKQVIAALKTKAPIEIINVREMPLPSSAYNTDRKQYDGQILLNRCIEANKNSLFLWIVASDLYVPLMNFVFGLASKQYGAVVSFYRLPSLEMKIKESLHEVGHVLGLSHCKNYCVMQFSNSLKEALEKPTKFCSECENKLKRY